MSVRVFMLVLFVLYLSEKGFAHSPETASNMPETSGAFYAISVKDMDNMIAWYQTHLGFKLISKGGNDVRSGALLSRQGVTLELGGFSGATSLTRLKPDTETHMVHGIFKIGFMTDHIDDTLAYFKHKGSEIFFEIVTTSDGKRTFAIKDPEGNTIQFYGQ